MIEFNGTNIDEYKWTPYPTRSLESSEYMKMELDEKKELPAWKRKELEEKGAGYVGKIQEHRTHLAGRYKKLKYIVLPHFEKEKNQEGINKTKELLREHDHKERNVDGLSRNRAFRSLAYTEGQGEKNFPLWGVYAEKKDK